MGNQKKNKNKKNSSSSAVEKTNNGRTSRALCFPSHSSRDVRAEDRNGTINASLFGRLCACRAENAEGSHAIHPLIDANAVDTEHKDLDVFLRKRLCAKMESRILSTFWYP